MCDSDGSCILLVLGWVSMSGELTPGLLDQALDLLFHDDGYALPGNCDGCLEIPNETGLITRNAGWITRRGAGTCFVACRGGTKCPK